MPKVLRPDKIIPYGRHCIDEDDIAAVLKVLRSDWLTTGPYIEEFEACVSSYVGAAHAVAVSSGTAALHAAMHALDISPGDEVIVPAITFVATANCVVYQGGKPVFADISPDTLLIDIDSVESLVSPRTKAIIAVDYAGQPCDYVALRRLADKHKLALVADASHSLGASENGVMVGALADLTTFSFHPVKPITTGEGGMVVARDEALAKRMRLFRNHGISNTAHEREALAQWQYEMNEMGYNYRITDIQCALGMSQLSKLPAWIKKRNDIACFYNERLLGITGIEPLKKRDEIVHAYHLYAVKIKEEIFGFDRKEMFGEFSRQNVRVNVHYFPVHLQPFYMKNYGTSRGQCPVAEASYEELLSLPIFPTMGQAELDKVISVIENKVLS